MKDAVERAREYSYRDRKVRKRDYRQLWIMRINAAVREHGLSYSVFMHSLKSSGIVLDRKSLADLAYENPAEFAKLVEQVQQKAAA